MTTESELTWLVSGFAELFEGNESATGTEEGGCDRTPISHYSRIDAHLSGAKPIGIYPMVQALMPDRSTQWAVKWGMVDFDEGDEKSWKDACKLSKALEVVGINGWIERSKSKGYHVWVFASDWVPAADMRRALLYVSSIVDTPVKEVNPKQESLEEGQLGNYARVPYPSALSLPRPSEDARRVVLGDDEGVYPLNVFVECARESLTSPRLLSDIAARYNPPVKYVRPAPAFEQRDWDEDDVQEVLSRLNKFEKKIWTEGPLDGGDRSSAMFKLANLLYENHDDMDRDEAYVILQACPWQKFQGRADEELRINKVLDRVWDR